MDKMIDIGVRQLLGDFFCGHMVFKDQAPSLTHLAVDQIVDGGNVIGLPENPVDVRLAEIKFLCHICHGDSFSDMGLQVFQNIICVWRAGQLHDTSMSLK